MCSAILLQLCSLAAVQSAWWSCLQLVLLGEAAFFVIYWVLFRERAAAPLVPHPATA